MDWKKITPYLSIQNALITVFGVITLGIFSYFSFPLLTEIRGSFATQEIKEIGIVKTYKKHYHFFFESLQNLADADISHDILIRKIATLQKELELEKVKNFEKEESVEAKKIAQRLKAESGSSIARVPDGIEYKVPTGILPHQLLVLGIEYFRKKDFEKSAIIFDELTHLKEDSGFRRPDYYLISAISWYQLKHFEMAQDYLIKTEKTAAPGSTFYRQSILWQSIVEQGRGNKANSQKLITRLISLYPESEEAAWVNQKLHERVPASHE